MALDRSEPADLIKLSRDPPSSPIAVITINCPKSLNSLTRPMMVSLAGLVCQLNSDPTVSVHILTDAGDCAFCSGVDLTTAESVFKGDVKNSVSDPVKQLETCKKPVIRTINGYAVTDGFEIALACDILVAGKDETFMDTHAKMTKSPSKPEETKPGKGGNRKATNEESKPTNTSISTAQCPSQYQ